MRKLVELTLEQIAPLIKDDPVRPHLSAEYRVSHEHKRRSFGLAEDGKVLAVVCTAHGYGVPKDESELSEMSTYRDKGPLSVVPYTIWSYSKGAGSELINALLPFIMEEYLTFIPPLVVTMSPKTEMAKSFHIKNGAYTYQENELTVNYHYPL